MLKRLDTQLSLNQPIKIQYVPTKVIERMSKHYNKILRARIIKSQLYHPSLGMKSYIQRDVLFFKFKGFLPPKYSKLGGGDSPIHQQKLWMM